MSPTLDPWTTDRPGTRGTTPSRRPTACWPAARPSLAARLDAWLADARVEGSADARAREHWLRAAADADATFAGVLLDLAERGVAVAVATVAGRRHQGVVAGARRRLRRAAGARRAARCSLALAAIASVRTAPAVGCRVGERVVTTDLRLGDVLGRAGRRTGSGAARLLDGSEAVAGELRSVGQDVVTVRTDGEAAGHRLRPHRARVAEVVAGLSDRTGQPLDAVSG